MCVDVYLCTGRRAMFLCSLSYSVNACIYRHSIFKFELDISFEFYVAFCLFLSVASMFFIKPAFIKRRDFSNFFVLNSIPIRVVLFC